MENYSLLDKEYFTCEMESPFNQDILINFKKNSKIEN